MTLTGEGEIPSQALKGYEKKSSVKEIVIGDGITKVGKQAFFGFSNLVTITFGDSIKEIDGQGFKGVKGVKNVFCYADPANLDKDFFKNIPTASSRVKIYVCPGFVDAYGEKFGSIKDNLEAEPSLVKMVEKHEKVEATCTEPGNIEYHKGNDNFYYKFDTENNKYVAIEKDSWIIPAGHDYVRSVCNRCGDIEEYTVTTIINDTNSEETVEAFSPITVTAPEVDGKTFAYWELNDVKASTSAKFSFVVLQNTTVKAVYEESIVSKEEEAILHIEASQSKLKSNNSNAIRFVFNRSLPQGYKVKEVGILYGTNKLVGASVSNSGDAKIDLTVNKDSSQNFGSADAVKAALEKALTPNYTGRVKRFTGNSKSNDGTVDFTYGVGTNTECYVYSIGYVKVTNTNGEEEVLYTDNVIANTYKNAGIPAE